jgi:hypothetical protein
MYVYVDETGDAGMKQREGTSRFFVIALVIVKELSEVEKIETKIQKLRHELRLHPNFEFKFNKCNYEFRVAFLRTISAIQFTYHAVVINKAKLYGPGFAFKSPFIKYATRMAFSNAKDHLERAIVRIDGSGDREFKNQMNLYLKRKMNDSRRCIFDVDFADSKNNSKIQMADMVAGAIGRFFGDKEDAKEYLPIIARCKGSLQVWPEMRKPKP